MSSPVPFHETVGAENERITGKVRSAWGAGDAGRLFAVRHRRTSDLFPRVRDVPVGLLPREGVSRAPRPLTRPARWEQE